MRTVIDLSPNCDSRQGTPIDMLVIHYTGMPTADAALARLCDPAARVSAHYAIDRKGCVYVLVPEEMRAWHAGASWWGGVKNVNARSIGVELVNPGHEFGYVAFADDQIESLIALAREILDRHAIPARNVVGHSDVAPARKSDPGELFDWRRLAEAGIGVWPQPDKTVGFADAAALVQYGYGVAPAVDVPLATVIAAFQRHFRPARIDGVWDGECGRLLAALLRS
jgi:N-acetylmuramoyl-L-alanine amidase